MRILTLSLFLVAAATLVGCGSKPPEATVDAPLAIEEWKSLPAEKKYEVETLERLKIAEPKLTDPKEWDRFMKTVLLPSKKKDGLNR